MYIKHLTECLPSVNGSSRSVRISRHMRYTGGKHPMRISNSSLCSWFEAKLEFSCAES